MKAIVFQIEEDVENGGYIAEVYTSNNRHIITQRDIIDELKKMIKDALECHFENPLEIPHKVIMKFIRQEVFAFQFYDLILPKDLYSINRDLQAYRSGL